MVPSVSSKEQGEDVLHVMNQRFQLPISKIYTWENGSSFFL